MARTADPARSSGARPKAKLSAEFGPWLRRQRTNRGWNQYEFAARARLGRTTLAEMERSRIREQAFAVDVFVAIADALDLELAYVLHKAGYDMGAGGINLARLQRVETVLETLANAEGPMREALAEAVQRSPDDDPALPKLARALAMLDLTAESLREQEFGLEGFRTPIPDEEADAAAREWTEADDRFLREHQLLTNDDLARSLGRTPNSIRARRRRLNSERSVA